MQCHRAFLVALLVVLRHIHVALCVACVIGHPHSHRSTCYSQLAETQSNRKECKINKTVSLLLKSVILHREQPKQMVQEGGSDCFIIWNILMLQLSYVWQKKHWYKNKLSTPKRRDVSADVLTEKVTSQHIVQH